MNMKALVADDSGLIRRVVVRALNDLGVSEIDEASDGFDGVQLVEARAYDLIITDWNMPHKSGLEVIKTARAAGQTCPIIMQTTEAGKEYVINAIEAGANDFILKPFTKDDILERLERYVQVCHEENEG